MVKLCIISLREGEISLALQNYSQTIDKNKDIGNVQIMGINPLEATKETIKVLDKYISTGIGYAKNINFLREYIIKQDIKLDENN